MCNFLQYLLMKSTYSNWGVVIGIFLLLKILKNQVSKRNVYLGTTKEGSAVSPGSHPGPGTHPEPICRLPGARMVLRWCAVARTGFLAVLPAPSFRGGRVRPPREQAAHRRDGGRMLVSGSGLSELPESHQVTLSKPGLWSCSSQGSLRPAATRQRVHGAPGSGPSRRALPGPGQRCPLPATVLGTERCQRAQVFLPAQTGPTRWTRSRPAPLRSGSRAPPALRSHVASCHLGRQE